MLFFRKVLFTLCLILLSYSLAINIFAQSKNGFDLSHASIDIADVFSGGPPLRKLNLFIYATLFIFFTTIAGAWVITTNFIRFGGNI
jgi:hypothetical protein